METSEPPSLVSMAKPLTETVREKGLMETFSMRTFLPVSSSSAAIALLLTISGRIVTVKSRSTRSEARHISRIFFFFDMVRLHIRMDSVLNYICTIYFSRGGAHISPAGGFELCGTAEIGRAT